MRFASKKVPDSLTYANLLPEVKVIKILSFFVGLSEILSQNQTPKNFEFAFYLNYKGLVLQIAHSNLSYLVREQIAKLTLPNQITEITFLTSNS